MIAWIFLEFYLSLVAYLVCWNGLFSKSLYGVTFGSPFSPITNLQTKASVQEMVSNTKSDSFDIHAFAITHDNELISAFWTAKIGPSGLEIWHFLLGFFMVAFDVSNNKVLSYNLTKVSISICCFTHGLARVKVSHSQFLKYWYVDPDAVFYVDCWFLGRLDKSYRLLSNMQGYHTSNDCVLSINPCEVRLGSVGWFDCFSCPTLFLVCSFFFILSTYLSAEVGIMLKRAHWCADQIQRLRSFVALVYFFVLLVIRDSHECCLCSGFYR